MRRALIVATDEYDDTKLARLNAPATDARELAEVLRDPNVGAFEVETVLNQACHDSEIAIARFLDAGRSGDTLLLHFSCHGVKDLSGELYFATTDTDLKLLKVTGVASSLVKGAIDESRASLILCLVDCCYSGAFTKSTKAAATTDLTERLGGKGRAVITASTSLQLALDGEEEPSLFTRAVLEGLRTGEADRDLDGLVSLDEFYSFVHDRVQETNPNQTPVKSFNVQGEVYVARRPTPVTTPARLPSDLLETLATGEVWQRRGAVTRLAELLVCGHPGTALAARLELERITSPDPTVGDDSGKVRLDAQDALDSVPPEQWQAIPEIPDRVEPAVELDHDAGTKGADTGTDLETEEELESDEELEEEQEEEEHEEVEPTPPPIPPPTPWWRRRVVVVGAAAAALVLAGSGVAAYVVWSGESLPESELVMVVDHDGTQAITAIDTSGRSEPRELVADDEAGVPTISRDRTALFYLVGGAGAHQPWRSSLDGSDAEELFDASASAQCADVTKPAESPDGQILAFVCNRGPEGQGILALEDGELDWKLREARDITGPLTWMGDDTLVFSMVPEPGLPARLYKLDVGDVSSQPDELEMDEPGWLTQPHWSPEGGLLYLRYDEKPDGTYSGDVYVQPDGAAPIRQTCDGTNGAPSWSPDGTRFAFLRGDISAASLQVQDVGDETCGTSREIDVGGNAHPPSWGPR